MPAKYLFILFLLIIGFSDLVSGQSYVALSIDDVPNTGKTQKENYQSKFLSQFDSLNIPVTIFINEGLVHKGDSIEKNIELLNEWMSRDYTTIGYHSTDHSRYSEVGLDTFKLDVEKGENIIREIARKCGKSVDYFRMPFNDLGKDSIQQAEIEQYLTSKNYILAPFTVESVDWAYNYVYVYYLGKNDIHKADSIAKDYVLKTISCFTFYDSISIQKYGKQIKQIYLCHDNKLNADYLPLLVNELKKKNYSFISFEEAMKDPLYHQEVRYFKKWGISWLYRWMLNQQEISVYMKNEPEEAIYPLYQKILEKQEKH
jgi:peptidoglycan/xylan/chitin deacetylase (PgdA/CDA1 family)